MTEYEYTQMKIERRKRRKRRNIFILSELVIALVLMIILIVVLVKKDKGEPSKAAEVKPAETVSGKSINSDLNNPDLFEDMEYRSILAFSGQTPEGEYFGSRIFTAAPEAENRDDVNSDTGNGGETNPDGNPDGQAADNDGTEAGNAENPDEQAVNLELTAIIEQADLAAKMYDYEKAIELVSSYEGYEAIETATTAIAGYGEEKSKLVLWPDNTTISHLFVHSLIVDTSRAFGKGSSQPQGYNKYMTTVDEFNKMLDQMYEKGYVLISIHDISKRVVDEEGNEKMVKNDIWLPEGKTPFVLSQDDVNYYQYMEKNGFADRLVIGEDGLPTCQYTDTDGNVMYGEYDMLPIVDRFVREHPDFSYHGAKGILAVTGYEGALGYDTGLSMKKYDGMSEEEKMKLIEEERVKAKAVADAIKADGWEFASHSYTHSNMTDATLSKLQYDTTRWHDEVEIIVGPTDIYIYPYGADICDWHGYKGDKFELLKEAGFWYFCNVDGNRYWIQLREQYYRMGRINADGERMYKTPERLSYFFDVDTVYDQSRPPFN